MDQAVVPAFPTLQSDDGEDDLGVEGGEEVVKRRWTVMDGDYGDSDSDGDGGWEEPAPSKTFLLSKGERCREELRGKERIHRGHHLHHHNDHNG